MCEDIDWTPDTRWAAFGFDTVESMMAWLALPDLEDSIPDELAARLQRIRRCLRLSYVEYELFDIVLDYAVVTVELGFKLRYKLHFGELPKRSIRFSNLIDWANKEGLLVGLDEKTEFLRRCRNDSAHPIRDSYGAIVLAPISKYVFEVLNSLFSTDCRSTPGEGSAETGTG